MNNFDIKINNTPDYSVITLIGQADMLVVEKLDKAFNALLKTPEVNIIVNLRDLDFICSIVLSCFIRAHRECGKIDGKLIFAEIPDSILKLFHTTQLDTFFTLSDTVEQASHDLCK